MAERRRRGALPPNAEINVTSLVDVAFTLLVIFIITAPILQGGIEVDLPRAESAPITQADAPIITVTRDGTIHLGEVEVSGLAELESLLPDYLGRKGADQVYVRGDTNVPYGRVLQVIGVVKKLGVGGVGLVSDPEERESSP